MKEEKNKQSTSENPSKQTETQSQVPFPEIMDTPEGRKAEVLVLKHMAELYKHSPETHKMYLTRAKYLEDSLMNNNDKSGMSSTK